MFKWIKRHWKNIALVVLSFHFIIDAGLWGNALYTLYKVVY